MTNCTSAVKPLLQTLYWANQIVSVILHSVKMFDSRLYTKYGKMYLNISHHTQRLVEFEHDEPATKAHKFCHYFSMWHRKWQLKLSVNSMCYLGEWHQSKFASPGTPQNRWYSHYMLQSRKCWSMQTNLWSTSTLQVALISFNQCGVFLMHRVYNWPHLTK